MLQLRRRIKNLVGYPEFNTVKLAAESKREAADVEERRKDADDPSLYQESEYYDILKDLELYGLGSVRLVTDYYALAEIDYKSHTCGDLTWCSKGELE